MLSAPDTRRWPPADSYINNLFLAATHQQIRMKMTDKDNEQSKYWRTDQKHDNRPAITHKLHNIKRRRVTRQHYSWVRDAMHSLEQHLLVTIESPSWTFGWTKVIALNIRLEDKIEFSLNLMLLLTIVRSLNGASTTILSDYYDV